MSRERKRCPNFSEQDEILLVRLVEKYKDVLENKKSDTATWKEKQDAWKKVTISFAARTGVTSRTWKTVRDKYLGLKRKSKTELATEGADTNRFGGGPSISAVLSKGSGKFLAMMADEDAGLCNSLDSDASSVEREVEALAEEMESDLEEDAQKSEKEEAGSCTGWKPLKRPRSKKTLEESETSRKRIMEDERLNLIRIQQEFYLHEDDRAQEKHEMEMLEKCLRIEVLQLEAREKKSKLKEEEKNELKQTTI